MAQEMRRAFHVVVRCRPLLAGEKEDQCSSISMDAAGGKIFLTCKEQENTRCFTFDRVLPPDSTQEHVMQEVSPMIDHTLNGFHSTVFAYGQTGSGKTYTVEGIEYVRDRKNNPRPFLKTETTQHGIIPRAIQLVFDRARQMQLQNGRLRFQFRCSFYQIYNERLMDLLNPTSTNSAQSPGLKVAWGRGDVFSVENLYICECDHPEKMRQVFFSGTKEKIMGSHAMNYQSSRSHCVFTIYVTRWDDDSPETPLRAELSVVDLAGSEKLAMLSKNPSVLLVKESVDINTSLLALGRVISALSTGSKRKQRTGESIDKSHIPYRESKLTMLLKHALGGNSLTTMIACISPSDRYLEETLSTLLYAGRARNITNIPRVNEDAKSALIRQLREEVANMKRELEYYRGVASGSLVSLEALKPTALDSPDDGGVNKSEGRLNELAENLLQACEALKNIIAVNGQLRDAFDTVKGAKVELERREVELNAENLALRERIELLESIVLKEDLEEDPWVRDNDVRETELRTPASHHGIPVESAASNSKESDMCSVLTNMLRRHPFSAEAPLPLRCSDQQVECGTSTRSRDGKHKSDGVLRTSSSEFRRVTSFVEDRDFMPSRTQQKERRKKKQSNLQKKLEEYTNRYCSPNHVVNYEEYYGKARQQIPVNRAAAVAIKEMEKSLKELPRSIVETMPQSLKNASEFGLLSFGGARDEVVDLQRRREEREAKRNALLAQQQTLKDNVTWTFVNATEQLESLRYAGAAAAAASNPYAYKVPGSSKSERTRTPIMTSRKTPDSCGMNRLRAYLENEKMRVSTGSSAYS